MSGVAVAAEGLRVTLGAGEVLHGIDVALPSGRWTAVWSCALGAPSQA